MELKPGYEFEQSLTARLADSGDSREARLAIQEKRAPQFSPDAERQSDRP
jgi:hypothetical protein